MFSWAMYTLTKFFFFIYYSFCHEFEFYDSSTWFALLVFKQCRTFYCDRKWPISAHCSHFLPSLPSHYNCKEQKPSWCGLLLLAPINYQMGRSKWATVMVPGLLTRCFEFWHSVLSSFIFLRSRGFLFSIGY